MAKISRKNTLISENVSVSDAYELFLSSRKINCAPKTYVIYEDIGKRHIIPSLTALSNGFMDGITTVVLRASIDDYAANHSKGGKWFYYRHLKVFINWYWDEFDIPTANPINKVKGIKKPRTEPKKGITREEINKLLKAAKEQIFPERDTAMLMILSDTGIRLSSLSNLKMKDVDVAKAQLTCFEKDQDFHIKTFGIATGKAIKKYLNCLEDVHPDDSFWLKMDGSQLTEAGLKESLRQLCSKAGIELHLFHDFRRFYGLELYKTTHDIYFVSRALDHKDIEVTKRYLAIDAMEDAEALRAMSPMDNNNRIKVKKR
jgi:integrase